MLTIIIIFIVYFAINLGLAKEDAKIIKSNLNIDHLNNTLVYIILLVPAYVVISGLFPYFKFYPAAICLGLSCWRRVVFDTALNLFRKLPINYISTTTGSWEDKISFGLEKKIGYYGYHAIFLILAIASIFLKF